MCDDNIKPFELQFPDVLACSFHDVKNSLELLSVTLDNLSEGIPEYPDKKEHLCSVQYAVLRISNTLTYMLTVYKMENRQFVMDMNHYSVHELLEETYYKHHLLTRTRGLAMEIICSEELVCFFDRNLVSIILDETINNSCRYTRSKLRVAASADEKYMTLVVEDDGPGYPDEILKMVNEERSESIKPQMKRNRTGLGMYFAGAIARNHTNKFGDSGHIYLSNGGNLGGSRFSLSIPL